MTWEELNKKYDREKRPIPLFEREPELEKNWGVLVRSTDKLLWLFALSGGCGRKTVKNDRTGRCGAKPPLTSS
ncbi:MAG: hypothetical protein WCW52_02380 [Elusimicrobiales bacterium]|jgi:hypothetical protein